MNKTFLTQVAQAIDPAIELPLSKDSLRIMGEYLKGRDETKVLFYTKVYHILVATAGARKEDWLNFVTSHVFTKKETKDKHNYGICREWRFCGSIGFGGKYWSGRNAIDCYREEENARVNALITETNEKLKALTTSMVVQDH